MVSSGPHDEAVTAAQVVLTAVPADDAGASTADRYDWQAAMAAADGLALYLDALQGESSGDDEDVRIVCEYHEDWVVVRADAAELVSAKHRESAYGVFTTIAQLLSDGGLAHLFSRWHTLKELPSCRLVTTAGLAPGPAQELERAAAFLRGLRLAGQMLLVDGEHERSIIRFAETLQRHADDLPGPWQSALAGGIATPNDEQCAQVSRFLSMLCIDHGKPPRGHVGHAAPSMYCVPVLECLGHDVINAVAVWEAVQALFRTRMRAAGPTPRGLLPAILAYRPGVLPTVANNERELAARVITLADIDLAVRTAIAHPRGYLPLPPAPSLSRIGVKMTAGRCTDNSIERAEHLRLDYQRYWRARINGDPVARASQEQLRRALLRISDEATAAVIGTGQAVWGVGLWHEMQARVEGMPAGAWPDDLDADLRLGGICDLISRCQVWFTDRFDVDAAIARLRAQQEPGS
jgi:hypothetical protein